MVGGSCRVVTGNISQQCHLKNSRGHQAVANKRPNDNSRHNSRLPRCWGTNVVGKQTGPSGDRNSRLPTLGPPPRSRVGEGTGGGTGGGKEAGAGPICTTLPVRLQNNESLCNTDMSATRWWVTRWWGWGNQVVDEVVDNQVGNNEVVAGEVHSKGAQREHVRVTE